jgi:hypothetical protein
LNPASRDTFSGLRLDYDSDALTGCLSRVLYGKLPRQKVKHGGQARHTIADCKIQIADLRLKILKEQKPILDTFKTAIQLQIAKFKLQISELKILKEQKPILDTFKTAK